MRPTADVRRPGAANRAGETLDGGAVVKGPSQVRRHDGPTSRFAAPGHTAVVGAYRFTTEFRFRHARRQVHGCQDAAGVLRVSPLIMRQKSLGSLVGACAARPNAGPSQAAAGNCVIARDRGEGLNGVRQGSCGRRVRESGRRRSTVAGHRREKVSPS